MERHACLAIYLNRNQDGFAKEIGDWAEGACERGLFVATTEEHLTTAIRFLFAQRQLAVSRVLKREIDTQAIETHVNRIRVALAGVKNINTSVTKGHELLAGIQSQAETLRSTVRDALSSSSPRAARDDSIEESLRSRGEGGVR